MDDDETREPIGLADADLVLRSRSGDRGAFGELWRRHYRAGVTVARNLTSSLDADDLVQEAYTRIYQSIITGRGPTGSFRAYLFTSIRNTAATWGRAQRDAAYDELEGIADPAAQEHASEAALDRGLTHQAFRSLPTRWQEVLWYSEIEQMKPAEIAPLLGMKPTAVAQLTFRAREGLREAWIQAHLRTVADGSDCQWTIERLGAHTRRNLGRRDQAKVDRHLADCVRCAIVASEAREVSSRLALVLLPLALGATGAAGYLATVQGGSAPLVALAAMPSSVVQGAVTVLPTVTKGVAAGGVGAGTTGAATATSGAVGAASGAGGASLGAAGASAATASAGAAAAGAAATGAATAAAVGGSAIATVGAASGIAASLVVVGGVVAAAVVLPNAVPGPVDLERTSVSDTVPATPGPLSSEEDSAGMLPDVGPDPADIPVMPGAVDGATGGATTPETGGQGGATGGAAEAPAGSGTESTVPGPATANAGNGGTGTGGTNGNPGTGGTHGNPGNGGTSGNPGNGGTGNGTDGTPGNGGSTGNGTPAHGTANGNGGITGNGGTTGNGTPTNGTGSGNDGVPGNGKENGGKGPGGAAGDVVDTPTSLGPRGLPAPQATTAAAIAHDQARGIPFQAAGAPVGASAGDDA